MSSNGVNTEMSPNGGPGVNAWDRLAGEPEECWTAFWRYRDLPSRPLLRVYGASIGRPAVHAWSIRWNWAPRLLAWDRALDGARQDVTMTATQKMAERHIELAKEGLECVGLAIGKIKQDLMTDFGRLKAQEVARLFDVCAKMERLSRGEATERVEGQDYSKLSDEDLATLEEIAGKVGR